MPGDFGGPVCSCAPTSTHAHETAGAPCTRYPRAPFALEGAEIIGKPRAERAARSRTHVSPSAPCLTVIARSICDEAIHSCVFLVAGWIASLTLAMTV